MPDRPARPAEPTCRVVARLEERLTHAGRIWRFVSSSEGVVDHAWQQRERLLQLSEGAAALEICWEPVDGSSPVELSHAPQLPVLPG
jgi:hypothetical protein